MINLDSLEYLIIRSTEAKDAYGTKTHAELSGQKHTDGTHLICPLSTSRIPGTEETGRPSAVTQLSAGVGEPSARHSSVAPVWRSNRPASRAGSAVKLGPTPGSGPRSAGSAAEGGDT